MTSEIAKDAWFPFVRPAPAAFLRLFCFHYAGGNAMVFRSWPDYLSPTIEVVPVQIPGHGTRLQEAPFTRMQPLVDAVVEALAGRLDKPFALFGHSMGAAISFEVAHKLRAERRLEPVHLFVSGRRAPQRPDPECPIHNLPEPEFIEAIRRLKGTSSEVLENEEILGLLIPMLRADFELTETCGYVPRRLLRCPITAMGGLADNKVSRSDVQAWEEQSVGKVSLHMVPGDHFFLHSAQRLVLQTVLHELQQLADCEKA